MKVNFYVESNYVPKNVYKSAVCSELHLSKQLKISCNKLYYATRKFCAFYTMLYDTCTVITRYIMIIVAVYREDNLREVTNRLINRVRKGATLTREKRRA